MRDMAPALRIAGIVIGVVAVISVLWVVLIGPATLLLLNPR
jgi:hypothetical protein